MRKLMEQSLTSGTIMRLLKVFFLCLLLLSGTTAAADTKQISIPLKSDRSRPLIAIIADNAGTETTDLIVPFGVLKTANVADVLIVSMQAGPINLMPDLTIEPDMTIAAFDSIYPEGADILIVPAMHDNNNKLVIDWVRQQAQKRTFIAAICEGAWIAARSGVLDGQDATTHWYALDDIARQFPKTRWVRDKRYIADHYVMTTTGVTASIPASLALVEAISGSVNAKVIARKLGVEDWNYAHVSAPFHLTAAHIGLVARNYLSFWKHETLSIPVAGSFDEIALALSADAWSRTYRSQAVAISKSDRVKSRVPH